MKIHLSILSACFFSIACLVTGCSRENSAPHKRIGLILPMEHAALNEIVTGFTKKLEASYPEVKILVNNAQGDLNTQRVIIEQMIQADCDVLVPIGMAATQMCANLTSSIPIVTLAAMLPPEEKPDNLTGVNDELGALQQLQFAQKAIPDLHKLTLIHSASEKIYPEVQLMKKLCEESGIQLQTLMIQNLPDLYPLAASIDPQSQLLLIFKDHLVVSGAATLAQMAEKLKKPFMASDEGSVTQGAAFALGVKEQEIGEQGAQLVAKVLEGVKISTLAPETVQTLHLFINRSAMIEQEVNEKVLEQAAATSGFTLTQVE